MSSVVLTALVSVTCSGPYQPDIVQACSSAIEAGARQSGVYQIVREKEQKVAKEVEDVAKEKLDIESIDAITTTALFVSLGTKQRTFLRLGTGPLGGSYHIESDTRLHRLGVGWDF